MDINMENTNGSGTKRNRLFSVEESSSEDEKSIDSSDDNISIPRRTISKTQARKDKAAKRDNQRSITYKSALKSNTIKSSLKSKSKTNHNTTNSKISKFSSTNTEEKKRPFQPINNNYKSRVTLKLSIPASDSPMEELLNMIKEFFTQLKEYSDESIVILPWKKDDFLKINPITKTSEVPKRHSLLMKYFPRLYPGKPSQNNTAYINLQLGHADKFDSIREDMKGWAISGSHGLYYNMLQAEQSENIGWLLYSTNVMNASNLAQAIEEHIGEKVGLRWTVVDMGIKGPIPKEQRINALHVEAEKKNKIKVKRLLLKLYGKESIAEDLPNGIRLRFVTLRKHATSTHAISKLDRLRSCQKGFNKSILASTSWDIAQLDYRIENKNTLRELIMNIKSKKYPDTGLFFLVDLDWKGEGYLFSYLPELKDEASSMIGTLYPYIRHKNNIHLEARNYAKELLKMKKERETRIGERTNEEIGGNNDHELKTDEIDMNSQEGIAKLEKLKKEKNIEINKKIANEEWNKDAKELGISVEQLKETEIAAREKMEINSNDEDQLQDDDIRKFFTPEFVENTEEMYYDTEKMTMIDPLIDDNLEFIDDEDLLGNKYEEEERQLTRPKPMGPLAAVAMPINSTPLNSSVFPDDDSVSTIGASVFHGASQRHTTRRQRKVRYASDSGTEASTISSFSTENFTSLQKTVELLSAGQAESNRRYAELVQLLTNQNTSLSSDTENNQSQDGRKNNTTGNCDEGIAGNRL